MAGNIPPAVIPFLGMEKRNSGVIAPMPLMNMMRKIITTGSTTNTVDKSRAEKAIFW
jgi:hypothetical protein